MEDEGADGGLGLHHEALGELDAAVLLGVEELEEDRLVLEVRAGRVAEADSDAAVLALELLADGLAGRVADAPHGPDAVVQELGEALGGFDGDRLQGVALEVLALVAVLVGQLAYAGAAGDDEHRGVVAPVARRLDEVGQAQAVPGGLAREVEAGQGGGGGGGL